MHATLALLDALDSDAKRAARAELTAAQAALLGADDALVAREPGAYARVRAAADRHALALATFTAASRPLLPMGSS